MVDLAMKTKEAVVKFKEDLEKFNNVTEVGVGHIGHILLDTDKTMTPVAERYVFNALQIPASYFKRASMERIS